MQQQTAVEWLINQLTCEYGGQTIVGFDQMTDVSKYCEQAKEMEFKQNMEYMQRGMELQEQENNRVGFRERNGLLSSQTEIPASKTPSNLEAFNQGYIMGKKDSAKYSQTEISDEEIEKAAKEYASTIYEAQYHKDEWRAVVIDFKKAIEWYREQLRKGSANSQNNIQ